MIKVLIVDDDFMVAKVHAGFVRQTPGFAVVGVAHTGAQALVEAQRLQPDLVLLDIHLPDISGLDLLQQLREEVPELDVLVISAAREVDTVRRALRGGIVHYLMKPFSNEDLRERLEHYQQAYRPLASSKSTAEQADVNRVFGVSRTERPLPKGCSVETLRLVEQLLRDTGTDLSASEAADRLGTSRVSARRYLEYLSDDGRVKVQLRYGGVGRPERRYVWRS
ncbi:response regulator [Arthrobacter crystallopoietes]|uniref:Transcriptional regulatory protein n=1 Tax=Crystallibacter crystallopoietes TaxID=37928 RepID=A0A1H1E5C1_9MICC|nr:response regulator [Arthrobacter crystallopoietes]AUI50038.1 two-component system response regulator [Arthrobacter crystallopoietes]SDQ83853.1 Response regulator of citrate/malate metabolism [Arthrobacter crystallopoietes]